ncbi:MAG: FkbM family methyltransferase [Bacteroidota bacterium]
MSGLLAEDPVVSVQDFGGRFALDARSHVLKRLLLDGTYEAELVGLCRQFVTPGRDAVDIGANAGFFSVLLANLLPADRVLAAEPSPAMARRLRQNLERNGVGDRVVVFEGAVADCSGTVTLSGVVGNEEYGTIGHLAHPAAEAALAHPDAESSALTVVAETLDALVETHDLRPGLLKVDTEGAEMLVLAGGRDTLRNHRPVLICEMDDVLLRANGTSAVELVLMLQELGYHVLDPFTRGHPPVTRGQLETPHVVPDVLCLPGEAG